MSATLGPTAGGELLDQLGFLHVPGPPRAAGAAYLFVALRRRPTLHHFDPERVEYWVTSDGHGVPAEIQWAAHTEVHGPFSWGPIRVVDRLNVGNEFVAFGGELTVAVVGDLNVAVFSSDAPILARGGHSQSWEPWSRDVVAFLAELRAAADPRGTFESQLAEATPSAIYAAYLQHELDLGAAAARELGWRFDAEVLQRERRRLEATRPADWQVGTQLLSALRRLVRRDAKRV
jgi:hypothetical protein